MSSQKVVASYEKKNIWDKLTSLVLFEKKNPNLKTVQVFNCYGLAVLKYPYIIAIPSLNLTYHINNSRVQSHK